MARAIADRVQWPGIVVLLPLALATSLAFSAGHADPVDWRALNDAGSAAADRADWPLAERHFRQAIEALEADEEGRGEIPLDEAEDARLAILLANLALVRLEQGDIQEARDMFLRALEIRRAVFGDRDVGTAVLLNNLGELERRAKRPDRALELHEAALALRRELRQPGHPEIAESLNNLGVALNDLGRREEAGQQIRQALEFRRERLGPTHADTLQSASNLVAVLVEAGNYEPARVLIERTLADLDSDVAANPRREQQVVDFQRGLIEILVLQGAEEDAVLTCENYGLTGSREGPPRSPEIVAACARAYVSVGAVDRAVQLLDRALASTEADAALADPAELELRWALAEATTKSDDLDRAQSNLDRVIEILADGPPERLALAMNNRAYLAYERGRPLAAVADLEAALEGLESAQSPEGKALQRDLLGNLANVLRALDRNAEAAEVEQRLLEMGPASGAGPADALSGG